MMNTKLILIAVGLFFPVIEAHLAGISNFRLFRQSEERCKELLQINAKETPMSISRTFMWMGITPVEHDEKCVAQCMLEDSKMVKYEEGRFVLGNLDEVKFSLDQTMKERIQRRVERCLRKVPLVPDSCEMGTLIFSCLMEDYHRQMAELKRMLRL